MSDETKQEVVATVTAAQKAPFSMAKSIAVLGVAMMFLCGFLAYLAYDAFYAGPKAAGQTIYSDAKSFVKNLLKSSGQATVEVTTGPGHAVMVYSLWEKKQSVSYEYSTTWMGSTKKIKLFREYNCRYGVDASLKGVEASWDSPGVLCLDQLETALVSMEPIGNIRIESEWVFLNRLKPEDCEAAHNGLLRTARRIAANDADALQITKLRFERLLRSNLPDGYKLRTMD